MTSLKLKVRVSLCVCFAANTESYTVYVAGARRNIEDRSSTHHNSKGIRWLASGWVQKNIFKNRRCDWLRAVTVGRGCWLSWNHSHCVTRACWACVSWCKWVLEKKSQSTLFQKAFTGSMCPRSPSNSCLFTCLRKTLEKKWPSVIPPGNN